MYIQNNLLGINILNNNTKNTKRLEKSINKLSSGYRVNIAADDVAGLSISEKLRGQIRGLKMASRNALDAYSFMETREGVLDEVHHMMQRMRELTIQSLNDTLTDEDREKIQKEFRALQVAISDFTKKSEFNTKPLFEAHEASFYSFEGNNKFDKLVKIDGFNNDLEVSVDGNITNISLDEGYYSIGEIADIIDTKLIKKNPNLIINLTGNNNLTLQSENSLSIDYIKGGLSFLFYEYHIGTPPGMIIGVTEFMENGRLNIIPGHNDKLKFYVGASKEYTINFVPKSGGYSIDELIDVINTKLTEEGEMDVKAIKYSDKHIALYSDKHVITGLSGNMIKIDGITSVLYDNAKYGYVSKGQGYVTGRKDLTNGVEIRNGENDTLKLKINNETEFMTINLLEDNEVSKSYSFDELINRIHNEAEKQGLKITLDKISFGDGGTNLRIRSNYFGAESKVMLDSNSNAYRDLFVGTKESIIAPDISSGAITSATILGRYVIGDSIEIRADENDTLELTVDGNTKTIKLAEGNYDEEALIEEINIKLNDSGLSATAQLLGPSGNKYALSISNNKIGEGNISISQGSNGFKPLFCESYFNVLENKAGKTTLKDNEEGIVGPIEVIETPAVLTGRVDLSKGINIDDKNDRLSFNMSGEVIGITLDHGSYNASELSSMISSKLNGKPIDISLKNNPGYGINLVFTTQDKGDGQYFKDIGGTAYSTILAGTVYSIPSTSSTGVNSSYSITGRVDIENNFVIDDTNNEISFKYVDEDIEYDIKIELDKATYINGNLLIGELNNKIQTKLQERGLIGDEVSASIVDSKIKLSVKESGPDYKLENFSGSFYDSVFPTKITNVYHPYSYSGYTNLKDEQLTYIVGREDLNKEMVIHPYVNDVLIFDFYHNSNKETFEIRLNPGLYDANSMVSEIQSKLGDELVKKGLDSTMLQVQIGGVDSGTAIYDANKLVIKYDSIDDGRNNNGRYIIDGVRGSAAYTVFYRAQGEPSPTHTIGIVDLSKGVSIKTGVNDTFIMDINEEPKAVVLEEKEYTSEELLSYINGKLSEMSINVVASYYEGRLKLSFNEVGANTIDGIRGNAKGTLFFNIDNRESDVPEYFQVGPNSGDSLVFNKSRVSAELMRINTITIHKSSFAEKALGRLDNAINYVSSERGRIGVTQNRLDSIIHNNENYEENLTAAGSRIRDIDMAKETMELTKQQILQQVTQAMMAQVNHRPEEVLKLLG